jgi:hypothetical protein
VVLVTHQRHTTVSGTSDRRYTIPKPRSFFDATSALDADTLSQPSAETSTLSTPTPLPPVGEISEISGFSFL